MEAFSAEQFSSSRDLDRVEAVDEFLEGSWFYDNLFNRKSKTLSYSFSDPFPSRRRNKLPEDGSNSGLASDRRLLRPPSLPPYIGGRRKQGEKMQGRREKKTEKITRQFAESTPIPEGKTEYPLEKKDQSSLHKDKESSPGVTRSDSSGKELRSSLQRTQTLPAHVRRDDTIDDKESYARMSILIREAMASSASENPPKRQQTFKGSLPKPSHIPRPPRSPDQESPLQNLKTPIRTQSRNSKGLKKTMSNLETQMKQARLTDLSPGLDDIYRSLLEKKQEPTARSEKLCKMPSLSETPVSENSDSSQDVKAQIKFWARVVASNVR